MLGVSLEPVDDVGSGSPSVPQYHRDRPHTNWRAKLKRLYVAMECGHDKTLSKPKSLDKGQLTFCWICKELQPVKACIADRIRL